MLNSSLLKSFRFLDYFFDFLLSLDSFEKAENFVNSIKHNGYKLEKDYEINWFVSEDENEKRFRWNAYLGQIISESIVIRAAINVNYTENFAKAYLKIAASAKEIDRKKRWLLEFLKKEGVEKLIPVIEEERVECEFLGEIHSGNTKLLLLICRKV